MTPLDFTLDEIAVLIDLVARVKISECTTDEEALIIYTAFRRLQQGQISALAALTEMEEEV